MVIRRIGFGCGGLAVLLLFGGCRQMADRPVDYNYDVRPILADHCYSCHGPDPESRQADVQLHTQDGLYAPLRDDTSRKVIVPGNASTSELVRRITHSDPLQRMPPPEAPHALTPEEITTLTRWVNEGAVWKPHWSHIPAQLPALPDVSRPSWVRNPIDRFVLARLDQEQLKPSPEAHRRTLIRRLYLDLIGLPPPVSEVRDFAAASDPDAYEQLVDRLLKSAHFGERMAQHWLDLARYADTNGYSIDGGRHMWLWRDWVIDAFNANKPFDEFVIEQMAGDLLPDATEIQRIATGFHRNHMITHEGGTIPEENLVNYVADRVKTTSEVFLGLTFACAQCHDHKYDPISQRDYYRFFAFFNSVPERGLDGDGGINAVPAIEAVTPLATKSEIRRIRAGLDSLQELQQQPHPAESDWRQTERADLALLGKDLRLYPLPALKVTTPNSGFTGNTLSDGTVAIDRPGWLAAYNVLHRMPEDISGLITGLRLVFYPDDESGELGYGNDLLPGSFAITSVHVQAGGLPADQVDYHNAAAVAQVTASHFHPDYPPEQILDDRRQSGWSPGTVRSRPTHLTLTFQTPLDASEVSYVTVMVNFGMGQSMVARQWKAFAMTGHDDRAVYSDAVHRALTGELVDDQLLRDTFYQRSEAAAPIRHAIANLEERLSVLTETYPTMVMAPSEDPRPTHILYRGQYDQPLTSVEPGVPVWMPQLPDSAGRLALAHWLMDPSHPLTHRVTVNRFWQLLFGRGLVSTPADFGARGALPSHPDLLDWLAFTFAQSGFDTKALLKTIVMSATYRQQSRSSGALQQRDPHNALLARGPRFRLQAEFIRDQALAISGLLVRHLGGPSVHPYQPPGLWKEVSHYGSTPATAQSFAQDHGEKLYRRSLYTYWKRTAPPPGMMIFDSPTREVCTITRELTNTPLQALVLLNDPQFVEASRAFAMFLLDEVPHKERISYAFEAATGRLPDAEDVQRLQARLEEELQVFTRDPSRAKALLSVGESPVSTRHDIAAQAAWTLVASALLNLSETITRS